ncbi:MAG: RNA polymerase sigma-54 factor, partial [Geovibrio sp.]|nr:RNA polymerase sigma-54 factor [Geovibrio sp.]
FIGRSDNLFDHLMFQLRIMGLGAEAEKIGEYIIGNLSEDGFFRLPCAEVAEHFGCTEQQVESVLDVVKGFEPSGIASSNLRECICRQLEDFGTEEVYLELAAELLENYEEELINFKYADIMKSIGIEQDTFEYLLFFNKKDRPQTGAFFSERGEQARHPRMCT